MIQQMLETWSLVPLPFLNLAWTYGSSFKNVKVEQSTTYVMQQSHSWAYIQKRGNSNLKRCIHPSVDCSNFIASSFRIWNSSTGIPSPPLPLFIVMLPKAYLTSLSRIAEHKKIVLFCYLRWNLQGLPKYDSLYANFLN